MVHGLFTDLPKFKDVRATIPKHPTKRFPILSAAGLTDITFHHALVRQGLGGANAEGYARFHVNSHGWPGIGYSYVIEPDGTIKFCNPIHWRTYHIGNANNYSVGICMTGDFRYEDPTPEQEESLRLLTARLQKEYPQLRTLKAHNEYPQYSYKACCVYDYNKILAGGGNKVSTPVNKPTVIGSTYKIQEGDTFWSIAKGEDFDVVDLEHANKGLNPQSLKIGQVINIPTKDNKATEAEKQSPEYHGNSITKYLDSIGENSSYAARVKLAAKYGIKGYKGTATQNIQLLNILRDGKKAPSTVVTKPTRTLKKGDKVTVPANKLYAQGNAVNPSSNKKLVGIVDIVHNDWRNSVRLKNSTGAYYIGFARLSDLVGVEVAAPKPSFTKLSVDGAWGPATTRRLQQVLGSTVDGIISGQSAHAITRNIAGVRFGTGGSNLVRAMQRRMNVSADGSFGPGTLKALQRRMGTPVTGAISKSGSTVVKELQRRLNNNTI